MKYNTYTLANGLRIIHLHSASPVVYCGYQVAAGTRDEQQGEEGMAHFVEHISFKGTRRRNALQILNYLERVGGDLNAYTNKDATVYYAALLKEHVARAVDVLTDMVFHSTYPQAEIDKEVEVICDEIESYNDSPAELIFDEYENLLFEGHPLGHNILGQAAQLRTFTTADALRFTQRYYVPQNTVFFAYGDVDFSVLVKMLEKATSDFPARRPYLDSQPQKTTVEYHPRKVFADKGTHQAHVMVGNRAYNAFDQRRIPLYLLNNIIGGPAMNARLSVVLRERNGLVYTVESNMVSYSDVGQWNIYFGCDAHDVRRCLRLVRRELNHLMERPLSARQTLAAQKQLKGQIGVAFDNRESFALSFGKSFLHYGWERHIDRLFQEIDAVTPQQMQQVAQEIFDEKRLTTLIYGSEM